MRKKQGGERCAEYREEKGSTRDEWKREDKEKQEDKEEGKRREEEDTYLFYFLYPLHFLW